MFFKVKKLETFIIISIIAGIGIIYAFAQTPQIFVQNDKSDQSVAENVYKSDQEVKNNLFVSYQGEDGKSALELLKKSNTTETKEYKGLGEFVTSINGLAGDKENFWSFYVNGKQAQVGASSYITKSTDLIEWKYEKVGEYK